MSSVKRMDLLARLRALGWRHLREGGGHEIWTNGDGSRQEAVPRHREINEMLARKIIRSAERNP
jgi:predicted RNA binding protein YcfA (HicA-like mRNA interferase family)